MQQALKVARRWLHAYGETQFDKLGADLKRGLTPEQGDALKALVADLSPMIRSEVKVPVAEVSGGDPKTGTFFVRFEVNPGTDTVHRVTSGHPTLSISSSGMDPATFQPDQTLLDCSIRCGGHSGENPFPRRRPNPRNRY
jgi:hypothetical protein